MEQLQFKAKNLQGHSFRGQNLSGANFTKSDIRSCDFSNASLEGASFQGTIAGLSRRQELILILVAIVLAFIAGFVASLAAGVFFIAFQKSLGQATLLAVLILAPILAVSTRQYGYIALASALAIAIAIAGAGIGALIGANMGALTVALFLIVGGIGAATGAGIYATISNSSVWIAGIGSLIAAIALSTWMNNPLAGVIAMTVAGIVEVLAGFVARSAFMGNEKLAFVRQQALAFTTWGGTSFYKANLINTNFSHTQIAKADFRNSVITCTNFRGAIGTEYCRFEGTVLYSPIIREVAITGNGQGKNFDGLSVRGINWSEASLTDASFIGSDLSEADLGGADLSRAKLVRTQLDQTNLTNACLTGAYIENWGITAETQIDNVDCKYVFMRLPTKDNPDPHRKPDNRQEVFADGEFGDFIKPIFDTLDLYHNQGVDPRAIAISFKQLAENHPEADLRIVGMEVRGQDKFLLRAKTAAMADKSELSAEYFDTYNQIKGLPEREIKLLLAEKDNQIRRLENMVMTALERPSFYSNVEQVGFMTNNPGGFSVGGSVDGDINNVQGENNQQRVSNKSSNFNLQGAQFGGGLVNADTVTANQIGGNITNYSTEQKQNLAEAAAEIQQLLNQLGQSYPTNTPLEKQIAVTEALKQIDSNPTLKARVIRALKSGGTEALKELVDHPLVNILLATLEGWQDAE